jgi:hypothetical protein
MCMPVSLATCDSADCRISLHRSCARIAALTCSLRAQERLRDRSGQLMNLRDSKRVAEIEKSMSRWDEVQLMRSGVVERITGDDDEDEAECVMLVVKDAKPPFLDGRQIFTKQMEPVVPLKDPSSDMAVVARKGSKLVSQVRSSHSVRPMADLSVTSMATAT